MRKTTRSARFRFPSLEIEFAPRDPSAYKEDNYDKAITIICLIGLAGVVVGVPAFFGITLILMRMTGGC